MLMICEYRGAEKEEYEDAGLSYHPRNKRLSPSRLQMVWNDNRSSSGLKPGHDLFGQSKPDMTQAAEEVLRVYRKWMPD